MTIAKFLQSVVKNKVFWYLASRYAVLGIQFLSSIYIAKRLGPHYWGEWSFMVLLISIGTTLDWGIANSINILLTQHLKEPRKSAVFCYNGPMLSLIIMIPVVLVTLYDRIFGIQYFMYIACKVVHHARNTVLVFGRNNAFFPAFKDVFCRC